MNDIINNSSSNQRLDAGDAPVAPAEHNQFIAQLGSELWNEMKSLTGALSPSDGAGSSAPTDTAAPSQDSASAHLPGLDLSDYKSEALKVFDEVDTGKQGFVTREQLALAVADDPKLKGEDAEALAVLYGVKDDQHIGQVPDGVSPYILTRAEVEAMPTSLNGDANQMREANEITHILHHADESLANEQGDQSFSNPAFSNNTDATASIKESDVKQGHAGDCYFDSALAAVAATQPETIRDSIQENPNGSYTVTFKGDPTHPITVPQPTDSELALYNGASKDGIWPNIMEKAFADHQILFGHRQENFNTVEDASSGGYAANAMALLTGEQAHGESFKEGLAGAELVNKQGQTDVPLQTLENAVAQGDIAVVGTGRDNLGFGLVNNHDYTVVGFQPGADGGTFELRNPWGDDSRHDGDEFSISGDELAASIREISYAPGQQ